MFYLQLIKHTEIQIIIYKIFVQDDFSTETVDSITSEMILIGTSVNIHNFLNFPQPQDTALDGKLRAK